MWQLGAIVVRLDLVRHHVAPSCLVDSVWQLGATTSSLVGNAWEIRRKSPSIESWWNAWSWRLLIETCVCLRAIPNWRDSIKEPLQPSWSCTMTHCVMPNSIVFVVPCDLVRDELDSCLLCSVTLANFKRSPQVESRSENLRHLRIYSWHLHRSRRALVRDVFESWWE